MKQWNFFSATLSLILWAALILVVLSTFVLAGCDFNYQPTCTQECSAGGGDDSFGAGAK